MKKVFKLLLNKKYTLIFLILMILLSLSFIFLGLYQKDSENNQSISDLMKENKWSIFSKELKEFIELTSWVPSSDFAKNYNLFLSGFIMVFVFFLFLIVLLVFSLLKNKQSYNIKPEKKVVEEKPKKVRKTTKK